MNACAICNRIKQIQTEGNPALIYEFPQSYLILGDHQYYPGYCVLIYKAHVRELHELSSEQQDALNHELMQATLAIVKTCSPWKINHACLGNVDEHIHWHIIPRYLNDPDHRKQPWLHAAEFDSHKGDDDTRQELIRRIRSNI